MHRNQRVEQSDRLLTEWYRRSFVIVLPVAIIIEEAACADVHPTSALACYPML